MQLLSETRRTRIPSRRSETDLRGDESGRSENKFARANQIDPSGQQVCTSKSYRPLWTTSSYKRIRSTCTDNNFARANHIDPFGQQVCTSESDRPIQTTRSHQPIISLQIARTVIEPLIVVTFFEVPEYLTVIEPLIVVTFFEVPKDRTVIEPLIAVTFFEVPEDRTVIGPFYYGQFYRSQLQDRTVMIRLRTVIATSKRTRKTLEHKSLYAQKPYLVRISRFERKSRFTRKAIFNHTQ